jgi:hypothetical protein
MSIECDKLLLWALGIKNKSDFKNIIRFFHSDITGEINTDEITREINRCNTKLGNSPEWSSEYDANHYNYKVNLVINDPNKLKILDNFETITTSKIKTKDIDEIKKLERNIIRYKIYNILKKGKNLFNRKKIIEDLIYEYINKYSDIIICTKRNKLNTKPNEDRCNGTDYYYAFSKRIDMPMIWQELNNDFLYLVFDIDKIQKNDWSWLPKDNQILKQFIQFIIEKDSGKILWENTTHHTTKTPHTKKTSSGSYGFKSASPSSIQITSDSQGINFGGSNKKKTRIIKKGKRNYKKNRKTKKRY